VLIFFFFGGGSGGVYFLQIVHRHVGETNMNEHSSRSHSLLRMAIESRERRPPGDSRVSLDGAVRVSCLVSLFTHCSFLRRVVNPDGLSHCKESCRSGRIRASGTHGR
jgi:hypothetical protein